MRIAFVGEALIDFAGSGGLAFQGYCGGSPLNAAVASARLGQPTGYLTQLSTDLFGDQLLHHMLANGIDTRFVVRAAGPSTVAFVERGAHTNRYAFYSHGSADSGWAPDPLPELPASCRFLHFGSISLLQDPAARRITDFVAANAGRRVVVFDPNVRLSLIDDLALYRRRTRHWLGLTDILKLSAEDAEVLAPGIAFDAAARDWLQAGPRAVIVTLGDDGAVLYRRGRDPILISAPEIEIADTIGAGDTFTAGISVALLAHGVADAPGLDTLPDSEWRRVLQFATTAAALNCMREGANPPTLAEVQAILPES